MGGEGSEPPTCREVLGQGPEAGKHTGTRAMRVRQSVYSQVGLWRWAAAYSGTRQNTRAEASQARPSS